MFKRSLLAEVSLSHGEGKTIGKRQTSAGLRRVLSGSRRPNLWPKLTGF